MSMTARERAAPAPDGSRPGMHPDGSRRSLELQTGGMSCASCSARVKKTLNKIGGVTATVNFATETARVNMPAGLGPGDLIAAVEQAGYTAVLPPPPRPEGAAAGRRPQEPDEAAPLRQRLLVSAALAPPVAAAAIVPALQFRNWQWVSLALASPVAVWGRGRSTGPPWPTSGTAPSPWTP